MRFAFKTSQQGTTWSDLLAVWQAADDIDVFESGWIFDHFYPISGESTGLCMQGWTLLAALDQARYRLRLGTLVTGIHFRHPAVLANMAATLDIVSGGRLELGIGAGWNEEESGAYGIELWTSRSSTSRSRTLCEREGSGWDRSWLAAMQVIKSAQQFFKSGSRPPPNCSPLVDRIVRLRRAMGARDDEDARRCAIELVVDADLIEWACQQSESREIHELGMTLAWLSKTLERTTMCRR